VARHSAAPTAPTTPIAPIPDVPACAAAMGAVGQTRAAVPILMYHYIRVVTDARDRVGRVLSVTPADFQAQMAWLHDHGAHTVTLGAIRASLAGGAALPAHPVALTFDDGHADFLTAALPVLQSYHFIATVFVVSGFVSRPDYLSIAQLRTLADAGMVIGAHTVDHVDLTTLSKAAMAQQIRRSRSALRDWTGQAVEDFAYPAGRHTRAVEQQVAAAGFRDAVTTRSGLDHRSSDVLTWTRVRVSGGESMAAFIRGLQIGFTGHPDPICATPPPPGRDHHQTVV